MGPAATTAAGAPAGLLERLRERWRERRDRWLTSGRFRERASRLALTRPVARRHARELFDLVSGFVYSQVLLAGVELGLFERLARAPLTAADLAREGRLLPVAPDHALLP